MRDAIYGRLQDALAFPDIGRPQAISGVRKLVTRYGHLIYDLADQSEDEIVVLAVRHSAQERAFEDD